MDVTELENWIDTDKHRLLLVEAKEQNITVTRLLLKILDHWITHYPACNGLVEQLHDIKDYLLQVASYANYEEKDLEMLIVEALDRGLSLILTKADDHIPFALA